MIATGKSVDHAHVYTSVWGDPGDTEPKFEVDHEARRGPGETAGQFAERLVGEFMPILDGIVTFNQTDGGFRTHTAMKPEVGGGTVEYQVLWGNDECVLCPTEWAEVLAKHVDCEHDHGWCIHDEERED